MYDFSPEEGRPSSPNCTFFIDDDLVRFDRVIFGGHRAWDIVDLGSHQTDDALYKIQRARSRQVISRWAPAPSVAHSSRSSS